MPPTLTSISPLSGPPGTVVTCVGTGFTAGSQVGCPAIAATTFVDAQTLTAAIPDMMGPAGGSVPASVFVVNPDGFTSLPLMFTVQFPAAALQTWTSIQAVAGELPAFQRGGSTKDAQIQTWIESIAQSIAGIMLRRGLSLNPADWQQPGPNAWPTPSGCLEMINRLGAAARLAAAIASEFGAADWAVRANLQRAFDGELLSLKNGEYDKLFKPSAATIDAGPLLSAGDTSDRFGNPTQAFQKERVF
jgi:hypothetical protein